MALSLLNEFLESRELWQLMNMKKF
jgi:hypothetical protein